MRPPNFWYEDSGSVWPTLLSPLGKLYDLGVRTRYSLTSSEKLSVPVICIGNLVAGGAGKTPTAIALGEYFKQRGVNVHFILRGYGGEENHSVQVDPDRHGARDVGDEALLLAARAATWSGSDRGQSARSAIEAGAQCLIFDDGFQNPSIHKDLSLIVIDGAVGLGNGKVIPAGPLRENPARGLDRAHGVLIVGEDLADVENHLPVIYDRPLEILRARLVPDGDVESLAGQRVFAFAGIGRPAKFFDTLKEMGCEIAETAIFDDHHFYDNLEITSILDKADHMNAIPVTTEKDYLRLEAQAKERIRYLPVAVAWRDWIAVEKWLQPVFEQLSRDR